MFYLVIFILIVIIILTILYAINKFKNFSYLKEVKLESKKKYIIIISIFCIFLAVALILDFINMFIFLFHFVLISLLVSLIFKIIKNHNYDLATLISIVITIIYLGYGFYSAYNVRKTTYNLTTNKNVEEIKIAQVTDSHLGTTFHATKFKDYILDIASQNPDLIVITGDFVDDGSTKDDLIKSLEVFKSISLKYGVYFVFGNHDKGLMNTRDFTESELRDELIKNNVIILEDKAVNLGDDIILVGRQDRSTSGRKSAAELINDLDKNKYIIVLDHQPNDYEALSKTNADLVLSGHTHGGQMIPLGQIGLMLGANDRIYGYEKRNNTDFIVSSGISDWAIKFKTGVFSEYVMINVKKAK